MMRFVALVLAVPATIGCMDRSSGASPSTRAAETLSTPASESAATPAPPADATGLALQDVRIDGVSLDMNQDAVIAALGAPVRRSSEYSDGLSDTLHTLEFANVSVQFAGSTGIHGVRCLSAACKTSRGVGIGTDLQALTRAYGEHFFYADDSTRVLGFDPPNGCALQFRLRERRVSDIDIICEI